MKAGSLVVVGPGIGLAGHCSAEARDEITTADVVLSVPGDPIVQAWIEGLNPNTVSLQHHYQSAPDRPAAYAAMVEDIMAAVRSGARVCAVFYGHPGVFVTPSHAAIRQARAEGYEAHMAPAISAEDCLFADLGVDPGEHGCQSYEARNFLLFERNIDPFAILILWQIAVVGDSAFSAGPAPNPSAIDDLVGVLARHYPLEHEVTIYEAATLPVERPRCDRMRLADVASASLSQASTLFLPPLSGASPSRRAAHDNLSV